MLPLEDLDGVNFLPLLKFNKQGCDKERSLIIHFPHYGKGSVQKPQSAIIEGKYKYLLDLEFGQGMLFDLEQDLVESKNLSSKLPEKELNSVRLYSVD